MLTKVMLVLFAGLTMGTAYMSYYSVGLAEPSGNVYSVRAGSVGSGRVSYGSGSSYRSSGGFSGGK